MSLTEIERRGLIPPAVRDAVRRVADRYAVAATPAVLDLIDPTDPRDPIAAQYVPTVDELVVRPEERVDPIGDDAFSPVEGVVHRHPDRVLLKPLLVCPVYCRFCFRRESVGPAGGLLSEAELAAAFDYIRGRPEVREVILTGGDPLVLSPRRLRGLVATLGAIPHVQVLRVHTRVPVAAPDRVTDEIAEALLSDVPTWVVVHTNHARELTPGADVALERLRTAGLPLLSQSVLLRGVNDDADVLEALFRALVRRRVKPYYLHHPDLARGTGHFRVSVERGRELMAALRGRISGLCLPTYVLDLPGGRGKVPLEGDYSTTAPPWSSISV